MAGNESDSWDEYPWVIAEHRPPPKHLRKRKGKRRDLNEGEVPTAYMIRQGENGVKWHSIIDILRPHSPPVEWPEYPDKPVEDDIPRDFNWDEVSDFDDDPIKELVKMGIPEDRAKAAFDEKAFNSKLWKKIKKMQELRDSQGDPELEPELPPSCSGNFAPEIPELIDQDPTYSDKDDLLSSVYLPKTPGYGGGVTDRLDEDDYYPHDSSNPFKSTEGLGQVNIGIPKDFSRQERKKDYSFDEDSGEISTGPDEGIDRQAIWKELRQIQ